MFKAKFGKAIWLLTTLLLVLGLVLPPVSSVLATPPIEGNTIEFAAGNGAGNVAQNFVAIAAGDLDNDGWLDLATGFSNGTNEVRVWENDGTPFSGTWSGGTGNAVGDTSGQVNSVALGDLDHDGDLDIVSGDNNMEVIIWRNDGTPFNDAWSTNYNIGDGINDVLGVVVVDLDGDGNLDIVSASLTDTGTSAELIAWENPYTSADTNPFDQDWTSHDVGNTASLYAVAVADLNRDGRVDIIAGGTGNQVLIWSNEGSWSFTSRATLTGDGNIDALATADLNRDGYQDIVSGGTVESGGTYEIIAWENDADSPFDWSFTEHALADTDADVNGLAAADYNNDGYPDLAAVLDAGGAYEVVAFGNDADATFDWSFHQVNAGIETANIRCVTAADLDNDGDADLATGRESGTGNEVSVWENVAVHRNALFDATSYNFGTGSDQTYALALSDLDGDGDLDLAVANRNNQQNVVYLNDGDGTFDTTSHNFGTGDDTYALALGDVDGDGDMDLAVGNRNNQQNVVYLNDGDGTFDTTSHNFGTGNDTTYALALGDLDGDGDLDLAVGNPGAQNVVYLGDGDGTFDTTSYNFGTGTDATYALALGDVDGDGNLDLAVGNPGAQNVVYLGDGDGTFDTTSYNFGTGTDATVALALGDVNGDGDLDLAVGNNAQQNVVYLGDGDGTFDTTSYEFGTGNDATIALALGDVDGDGDLDLAVGNNPQQNAVYLNDGDGTFDTTPNNFGTGSDATIALTLGDVDGDGDLDLAVGNRGEQNTVRLNYGGTAGFTVTDTAPNIIDNGSEDDVFRIVFTHNGIAADRDLELNYWNVDLLDSDCSTPLTSAQANAIIDNLRVRLDDGDAVFETSDVLVANVSTLALDGGVQQISFTNDDTNVQVDQDVTASRTYWLSLLLTSNASSQTPNAFCLNVDPDADFLVEGKTPDFSVSVQDSEATDTGAIDANPTAVTLASFTATPQDDAILVAWETAMELDNVGFNLYRSTAAEGPYTQLNATLIPPQFPGEVMGGAYEWLDADVQPGVTYFYKLEDIDVKGVSTFHGPVSTVVVTEPTAVQVRHVSGRGASIPPALGMAAILGLAIARRRRGESQYAAQKD